MRKDECVPAFSPSCHGVAVALHNSGNFSPSWALIAKKCEVFDRSHDGASPTTFPRFLFGLAAPDFCVSLFVLHGNGGHNDT
jgi:hypothetical protein